MRKAYAHCEDLVRATDKDRFLTALFLPESVRPHIFALYAFNAEIAAVRDRANDPLAGEIRFQWWRDVLAGRAAGGISGNPVAAALIDTIEKQFLPVAVLARLIEAREFDLYDDPMPSVAAFEAYVRLTASSLFELTGMMLTGASTAMAAAAGHAGLAYGITGLMRAIPMHASRGQIYLPVDLLSRHHADLEAFLSGNATPGLLNALTELRDKTRQHFAEVDRLLPQLSPEVQAAFLPLALVDAYLAKMERRGYDPFLTPIEIPQWRRQWMLWRAARRAP
jgi:15-cis-phytoene synthase